MSAVRLWFSCLAILLLAGCATKQATEPYFANESVCAQPESALNITEVRLAANPLKISKQKLLQTVVEKLRATGCYYVNAGRNDFVYPQSYSVILMLESQKQQVADKSFWSKRTTEYFHVLLQARLEGGQQLSGSTVNVNTKSAVENRSKTVLGLGEEAYTDEDTITKALDLAADSLVEKLLDTTVR